MKSPTIVLGRQSYLADGKNIISDLGDTVATATGPAMASLIAAALNQEKLHAAIVTMFREYDYENYSEYCAALEVLRSLAGIAPCPE